MRVGKEQHWEFLVSLMDDPKLLLEIMKPLVIAQVAFSIVLLIAAGLVTQNLRNLEDQNFGFVTEGRLIVNIDPSLSGYTPDKLYGLYQRLQEKLPQIPGVLSASLSGYSPLGGNNWNEGPIATPTVADGFVYAQGGGVPSLRGARAAGDGAHGDVDLSRRTLQVGQPDGAGRPGDRFSRSPDHHGARRPPAVHGRGVLRTAAS